MLRILARNSALMGLFAVSLAIPVAAQQNETQQSQQNSQRSNQRQSNQGTNWQLDPMGTVTIGVDRDGDGTYEGIESITYYDLQQAMQRSQQRRGMQQRTDRTQRQSQMRTQTSANRPNRRMQTRNGWQRSGNRQSMQSRQQNDSVTISGTVTEVKTFRLADGPNHKLAKIETQDGKRIPVDLGRVEQLDQIDLQDGDQVTVTGVRVRMNDKKMLNARRIQTSNETVNIGRERDRGLKRVQGEIDRMFTRQFQGFNQEFQIARVDLNGGRTETVILGPANKVDQLDLQQGDQVQMLVRRGKHNDKPALIADQIRSGDSVIRTQKPQQRQVSSKRN